MAQRRTTHSSGGSENYEILKFCAFWGLVLSGVTGLIGFIIALLAKLGVHIDWAQSLQSICSTLSLVAMLVGIALGAWLYVNYKTKAWKITYIVAIVFYILGIVGVFL